MQYCRVHTVSKTKPQVGKTPQLNLEEPDMAASDPTPDHLVAQDILDEHIQQLGDAILAHVPDNPQRERAMQHLEELLESVLAGLGLPSRRAR